MRHPLFASAPFTGLVAPKYPLGDVIDVILDSYYYEGVQPSDLVLLHHDLVLPILCEAQFENEPIERITVYESSEEVALVYQAIQSAPAAVACELSRLRVEFNALSSEKRILYYSKLCSEYASFFDHPQDPFVLAAYYLFFDIVSLGHKHHINNFNEFDAPLNLAWIVEPIPELDISRIKECSCLLQTVSFIFAPDVADLERDVLLKQYDGAMLLSVGKPSQSKVANKLNSLTHWGRSLIITIINHKAELSFNGIHECDLSLTL